MAIVIKKQTDEQRAYSASIIADMLVMPQFYAAMDMVPIPLQYPDAPLLSMQVALLSDVPRNAVRSLLSDSATRNMVSVTANYLPLRVDMPNGSHVNMKLFEETAKFGHSTWDRFSMRMICLPTKEARVSPSTERYTDWIAWANTMMYWTDYRMFIAQLLKDVFYYTSSIGQADRAIPGIGDVAKKTLRAFHGAPINPKSLNPIKRIHPLQRQCNILADRLGFLIASTSIVNPKQHFISTHSD